LHNGPELTAFAFTGWFAGRGIEARFIQPRKVDKSAFIERFNKTYARESSRKQATKAHARPAERRRSQQVPERSGLFSAAATCR
jgi:transposase InsO family protein